MRCSFTPKAFFTFARGVGAPRRTRGKLLRVRGQALGERVEVDHVPHVVRADGHGVLARVVRGRPRARDRRSAGSSTGTDAVRVFRAAAGFRKARLGFGFGFNREARGALGVRLDGREGGLVRRRRGGRRGGGEGPAPGLEAGAHARRGVGGERPRGRRPPSRRGARPRASRECRRRGLGECRSDSRWAGGRRGVDAARRARRAAPSRPPRPRRARTSRVTRGGGARASSCDGGYRQETSERSAGENSRRHKRATAPVPTPSRTRARSASLRTVEMDCPRDGDRKRAGAARIHARRLGERARDSADRAELPFEKRAASRRARRPLSHRV